MATKDTNFGLLSKMAKFVRNPTTDWGSLDMLEPTPDADYSKLALKEVIERKRQNDFVRRREFDYLRKLRRNGLAVNLGLADRPSFFPTSMNSKLDERATTIKKIDEIEAHMSKQWWRGKQDDGAAQVDKAPAVVVRSHSASDVVSLTFESTQTCGQGAGVDSVQVADYEPTQMGLITTDDVQQAATSKNAQNKKSGAIISGFVISQLFADEPNDGLADPDLEEAAIRFANGDDVGAEAGLLAALQGVNATSNSADGWAAALFDLYRATGQQSSFDRVAIDCAQRFGRSAPAWFSTPDLLGHKRVEVSVSQMSASEKNGQAIWVCPPAFDYQALQTLLDGLSPEFMPWQLNWGQLDSMTPQAAKALAELLAQWCSSPVRLQFFGAEVLEKTLMSMTPSGDKRVESFWWQLRLDVLRILRLQDEFELVALDFCVTYEVSPPSWNNARCELVQDRVNPVALFGMPLNLLTAGTQGDASPATTVHGGLNPLPAAVVELSGDVLGDAVEVLDKLQEGLMGADRLVISCGRLIRVDFSAAGSILNWVAVRESEGCKVQFRDVPRLVAAFFNVIGINEHASVVLRTS